MEHSPDGEIYFQVTGKLNCSIDRLTDGEGGVIYSSNIRTIHPKRASIRLYFSQSTREWALDLKRGDYLTVAGTAMEPSGLTENYVPKTLHVDEIVGYSAESLASLADLSLTVSEAAERVRLYGLDPHHFPQNDKSDQKL